MFFFLFGFVSLPCSLTLCLFLLSLGNLIGIQSVEVALLLWRERVALGDSIEIIVIHIDVLLAFLQLFVFLLLIPALLFFLRPFVILNFLDTVPYGQIFDVGRLLGAAEQIKNGILEVLIVIAVKLRATTVFPHLMSCHIN